MKKKVFLSLVVLFALSTVISSCVKYEDGPTLSLRSAKGRITGDWKLVTYLISNADSSSLIPPAGYHVGIEKDGSYKISGAFTDAGKWELGEDKDDIRFTSSTAGVPQESYRILKLKNKELWWKHTNSNGVLEEFHFLPE